MKEIVALICALALAKADPVRTNKATHSYADPTQAATICAADNSDSILIAHQICNQFYQCWNGQPVVRHCYGNLQYNPDTEVCDWPYTVDCGDRIIAAEETSNEEADSEVDEESGADNNSSTGNCDPSQAASICASEGSDGTLVAHENCNKYYICNHGVPVVQRCPGTLLFDPFKDYCDWPKNVDCGDRVICEDDDTDTGNGGSDNGSSGNGNGDAGDDSNGGNGAGNCDPSQAGNICASEGSDGTLVAHENCNKYYICNHGVPVVQRCPGTLLFDPFKDYCDWPKNVDCGDRVICEDDDTDTENGGSDNGSSGNGNGDAGDDGNGGNGAGNCDPSQAGNICASEGSDGTLVAHENCNKYYICNHGVPVVQRCPGTLLFDPFKDYCDWPKNVDCGDRVICEDDDTDTGNGGSDNGSSGNGNGDAGDDSNGGNGAGNCDPSQAGNICASEGSDGTLVAHENCNKYYICNHGVPVVQRCPGTLLFDPFKDYCDWPKNVDCGDRVICEDDDTDTENGGSDNGSSGNGNGDAGDDGNGGNGAGNCDPSQAGNICASEGSDGTLVAHENCNKYYICNHGVPVVQRCPGTLLFDPFKDYCDWPKNVDCGDRVICEDTDTDTGNGGSDNGSSGNGNGDAGDDGNGGNGAGNCDPSQAGNICASEGSDGTLVAHENCNKYYICNHGVPVAQRCPGTLLFDPFKDFCDWPENVDCGDRVISEGGSAEVDNGNGESDNGGSDNDSSGNGGSDNGGSGTCNCNPAEAPGICAADRSESTLIAHENCHQYYICVHGRPITMTCPGSLFYNPYTEVCDWPEKVECGDRVIPEVGGEDNSASGETENGGTDDGGNGGSESGGSDNGGSDNGGSGTCNCNPAEAPEICAINGSDGTHIAHENCNQFYTCVNGNPVAMTCPSSLHYNPYTQVCDWPENVECGERVIPEVGGEDNSASGETENGGTDDGGNGGSENGGSDNGGSDNGGSGTCNCNPAEAPEICAIDGSDGTLIAHENCNQFYTCVNGNPVAMTCPGSLHYNPYTQVCDWPENVECGERVIPEVGGEDNSASGETENGGTDDGGNGGSENGGSDNGGSDNGGSGTCNCNPAEAPAICAADGSDGVFIAHENCNQFYTCVNGNPVAMTCPGSLHYNPYTQVCDWPENVECGERVIPEVGGEDNSASGETENGGTDDGGNGGSENGGSDNGGSDNGGSGTCNCNPVEAPEICAINGSDGTHIAHENCNQFYTCVNGNPVAMTCPSSLHYNPFTQVCDWPENVECGERVIPEVGGEDNSASGETENGGTDDGGNGGSDNGGSDNGGSGTCNCNPAEAPEICAADGSDGTHIAHENCNQFYTCVNGNPVAMTCPGSLHYNPFTQVCDWPENVECGERVIPEVGGEDNSASGETENGGTDDGGNSSSENGGPDNGGSDNGGSGTCNCNPAEAPEICAINGSDGTHIAHENCNQFYTCVNGSPVAMTCGSLHYNPYTQVCDWPENVECGERVIPEVGGEDNSASGETENGSTDDGGNGGSENEGSDNGGSDNGGSGTCNCNSAEAPAICAADGSDGVFIAHENCNQFYTCVNGNPVAMTCPGSLHYNPYTQVCDWPENVECGERVIPEVGGEDNSASGETENGGTDDGGNSSSENGGPDNGGSDNGGSGTCNCNPAEAPEICAINGSDGTHIAHENCNQFYTCVNGSPVAMTCGSLHYNPYTQVCDWPENVECGERVIPEVGGEDNSASGETENGSTDDGGNGGSENEGSDNGGSDNGGSGTCNCNSAEAPAICAADGSDGVFIAHENCNQFYTCVNGNPVAMTCPGSLHYNPYTQVCDWPENVECGERVIPEVGGEDNSASGETENGGTDDGGNGGSENGGSDNGGSDNVGSGTCNCNPAEAPEICATDGSDGTHIAHENCNQFYTCVNGNPVAMTCPGSLHYNPYTQVCDWPENVECGERVIPEVGGEDNSASGETENGGTDDGGNGGSENGGSDSGGSDNGGSDNGGSGTCNCNPAEAPAICAADGSDGVFIAHKNCNQFYTCVNGNPVAMTCPGSLHYNPYTQVCDWPENVECGERVIPEVGGEDNSASGETENGGTDDGGNGGSENGGSDSGGSDNGGSDNGGSGTCNCNPAEAPAICAADGSDGVFIAHENCNQFYTCVAGQPVTVSCPGTLNYNPYTLQCDWPENVVCEDRIIPEDCEEDSNSSSENDSSDNSGSDNGSSGDGGSDNSGSNTCNCNPTEAPAICAADESDGAFVAHENCNQFYTCVNAKPVTVSCPGTLHYNPYTEQCDWPENVVCGDRIIPEDCEEGSNSGSDNGSSENGGTEIGGSDNGGSDNSGSSTCNCNPAEAPTICAADGSEGVFVAHENCNQFYTCLGGVPVTISCPGALHYNPYTEQCDWPDNVVCGDRIIPEDCEDNNSGNDNSGTDNGGSDNDGSDNSGSSTCNCNPAEAPTICAADGSEGVFVAHENCNQFYTCLGGVPVSISCPGTLHYNPYTEQCDWPDNVVCGDRIIPGDCDEDSNSGDDDDDSLDHGSDNDTSDNINCNCNPSEAPAICAADGSDGVFVAHENCKDFYTCIGGQPVTISCAGITLYNPYTQRCDWPENVICGDRTVPENNENEDSDNAGADNDGSENSGTDNADSGTYHDNPAEAPAICAAEGSDGVFVAHENCNEFYTCVEGKPVTITCAGITLYNPSTQRCDWPENVVCGDREIPEENNNQDENDANEGTVIDAAAACAASENREVFVAHENCNQFYVCINNEPVLMTCSGTLLYNPATNQCDWPQNVVCSAAVPPNDASENTGESDDIKVVEVFGDNNKGETDHEEEKGDIGYDIAVETCTDANSAGVIIPHEECHKFYVCVSNKPTVFTCSSNFLYDTDRMQCNYPENVDCGSRIITTQA